MSIKVGVLGIGEHARRNILPALDECNSVKLVGLSGRNTEHLEKESQKYNCTAYVNPEDMLSDPKIDVVYIALPVGLHKEWGDRVLQAGKHLWCEKSLTHDPELSRQLISKAQQHDLCVCECFMYVHHPMFAITTCFLFVMIFIAPTNTFFYFTASNIIFAFHTSSPNLFLYIDGIGFSDILNSALIPYA